MWRIALLALIAAPPPAFAQACEASASGPVGEVSVAQDGAGGTAVWIVAREANLGEETDNFARPGFEIEFKLNPDGSFGDVANVSVPISRVSGSRVGPAPAMSSVTVRATFDGKAFSWRGDRAGDGELKLAWSLLKQWPTTLVIDVAPRQGKPLYASATFDLGARDKAQELARKALGECAG